MIDFNAFSNEVFQILRSYEKDIVLYDDNGTRVFEPEDARRMYVIGDNLLISIVEDGDNSALKFYLSPSFNLAQVDGLVETLRRISVQSNLLFHVKKYNKEIKPKDFAVQSAVKEQQENQMNIMEGLYGTSKSSYLKLENARMIVRHSARVNERVIGDRGRHISSIFVENQDGERFRFPVNMLSGARAMTQHVNNGGTFADEVGSQIIRMARDFGNLAQIANSINARPGISEAAKEKEPRIEAYGVKGVKSKPWRKEFKNQAAYEKFFDNEDNASDIEVHGTREIEESISEDIQHMLAVRRAVYESLTKVKRSFDRMYESKTYMAECQRVVEAASLMENSDDLSTKLEAWNAILGEGYDEDTLMSAVRMVVLPEAQEVMTEAGYVGMEQQDEEDMLVGAEEDELIEDYEDAVITHAYRVQIPAECANLLAMGTNELEELIFSDFVENQSIDTVEWIDIKKPLVFIFPHSTRDIPELQERFADEFNTWCYEQDDMAAPKTGPMSESRKSRDYLGECANNPIIKQFDTWLESFDPLQIFGESEVEYDQRASQKAAQPVWNAIDKKFGAYFTTEITRSGAVKFIQKGGVSYMDHDENNDFVLSPQNLSKVIDPYFYSYRQKGWHFSQPAGGEFFIGVPMNAKVKESSMMSQNTNEQPQAAMSEDMAQQLEKPWKVKGIIGLNSPFVRGFDTELERDEWVAKNQNNDRIEITNVIDADVSEGVLRKGSKAYNEVSRLASSNIDRRAEEKQKAKAIKAKSDEAWAKAHNRDKKDELEEGAVKDMISGLKEAGWYAFDAKGKVVQGPETKKADIDTEYLKSEEHTVQYVGEDDLTESLNEAKAEKQYEITKTKYSNGKEYKSTGTLSELVQGFSYTLSTGASYQHERGNKKIDKQPKTFRSLISNLNAAVNNAAANGAADVHFSGKEIAAVTEGKTFKHTDDDEGDVKQKRKEDKEKRDSKKQPVGEGKTHKRNDDEDTADKKEKDQQRKDAAKNKRQIAEALFDSPARQRALYVLTVLGVPFDEAAIHWAFPEVSVVLKTQDALAVAKQIDAKVPVRAVTSNDNSVGAWSAEQKDITHWMWDKGSQRIFLTKDNGRGTIKLTLLDRSDDQNFMGALVEGKTHKRNDDEDTADKKEKDQQRKDAAKNKRNVSEGHRSEHYEDSKEGVLRFTQFEMDKRLVAKLDLPNCKIHRDPEVEGVWAIDNVEKNIRVVVYMAGYREPFGNIRDMNDFEEGQLRGKNRVDERMNIQKGPDREDYWFPSEGTIGIIADTDATFYTDGKLIWKGKALDAAIEKQLLNSAEAMHQHFDTLKNSGKLVPVQDAGERGMRVPVPEGKTHKRNDDEDTADKKQKDQERKGAAKNKRQVNEFYDEHGAFGGGDDGDDGETRLIEGLPFVFGRGDQYSAYEGDTYGAANISGMPHTTSLVFVTNGETVYCIPDVAYFERDQESIGDMFENAYESGGFPFREGMDIAAAIKALDSGDHSMFEGKSFKRNKDDDADDKKQKDQERKGAAKNKRQVAEGLTAGAFFKSVGSSDLKFCKRIDESRALISNADGTETWTDVAALNVDPASIRKLQLK